MRIRIMGWSLAILIFAVVLMLIWEPWRPSTFGNVSPVSERLTIDSTTSPLSEVASVSQERNENEISSNAATRDKLNQSNVVRRQDSSDIALPSLAKRDRFVRSLIREIPVSDPRILGWFDQEALIPLLAEVLVMFSDGQLPRFVRLLLKPKGTFLVDELNDEYFIASENYARFDSLVDLLVGFDSDSVADIVRKCEPLFSEALINLGRQESFRRLLADLTKEISSTPLIYSDTMLIRPNVLYVFNDPKLESLSPLQKQLLRMGPINIEKIQTYLNKLVLDLGIVKS